MNELLNAIKRYELWMALGWNDVLGRYRRSVIGPFWITISMGVTISAMGPLYGTLFGNNNENFILHLSLGMVFWSFISSCINESCNAFHEASNIIKQSSLPISIYIFRVFYRQAIIMLHNIIIIPVVMVIFKSKINLIFLIAIPAMLLTFAFIISTCMLISIFSTRYRDMAPVIQSIMTLIFFITPIIWSETQLPEGRRELVSYNILSNFIEIMRDPLMGEIPSLNSWLICILTTTFLSIVSAIVVNKYKNRIAYWL